MCDETVGVWKGTEILGEGGVADRVLTSRVLSLESLKNL